MALVALCFVFLVPAASAQITPDVGGHAPNFTLPTSDGKMASLAESLKKGPVVLVVLRGFPGYQCPFCVKQVQDYVQHAAGFAQAGATVLLVYPGPPGELDAHAKEFLAQQQGALPANVKLLIDADYRMTNQYGLRWEAPHETAYPSTFVLERTGLVLFRKVSAEHGGRTSAAEMVAEVGSHK